jgi:four helix bundle protein
LGLTIVTIRHYRDLRVWQAAMDFAANIYQITRELPADERFGLCSQLRRAAVSIPSNIAEGHTRGSTKEFRRYIGMAMGSLSECETQLLLAWRIGFLEESSIAPLLNHADQLGRQLRNLKKKLNDPL